MNKSVLIATCDFLVLAVLSLNPTDSGTIAVKNSDSTPTPTPSPAQANAMALVPVSDFKLEAKPLKAPVEDDLLLAAARKDKQAMLEAMKKLNETQEALNLELEKTAAIAKAEQEKLQADLSKVESENKQKQVELAKVNQVQGELKNSLEVEKVKAATLVSQVELMKSSIEAGDKLTEATIAKLESQNKIVADGRNFMKSRYIDLLRKNRVNEQKLEAAVLDKQRVEQEKSVALERLKQEQFAVVKLKSDLEVSDFKNKTILEVNEKTEKKLEKVEKVLTSTVEKNTALQSNLAVTKTESKALTGEVQKLNKQIFGPTVEISDALYQTTMTIKTKGMFNKSSTKVSYSPVIKMNDNYYTIVNYDAMGVRNLIVDRDDLKSLVIHQQSENTGRKYLIPNSFSYFTDCPQTLLVPCAKDTNALSLIDKSVNVAAILPTLFVMKQDTGKIIKAENMFYDRSAKVLVVERGLSEEASANQAEEGDLIVDEGGKLVGVFANSESKFSFKKSTRLEAFVFAKSAKVKEIKTKNLRSLPAKIESLKWAIIRAKE
ncbi:MAG: hypothetical protein KAG98_04695 [Lentisphaeria bacterium]|nr:hypothetical protein [Lentisphaeria bacterium]